MNSEFSSLSDTDMQTEIDAPDLVGRVIDDRYRVIERLAEGGMGTVYTAEHLALGKEVALKTIHPTLAGDEELAVRFAREAMASAKLEHPHVASALDYGTLPEGGSYLVMQLVRGPSLQDVVEKQGRISWPRVCSIGAQVADALAAAHAEGIIHRDLKPENVLLEPRDDGGELVKVLDFGIARLSDETSMTPATAGGRALTRRGTVMGTPGYMAPEQALGEAIDHRVDLYALGTVLWESITGLQLWSGDTLTDIVTAQLSPEPTERLKDVTGDESIPAELQALLDEMLKLKASDRPDTAAKVRDRLRQLALEATMAGDPRARLTPPTGVAALVGRADPSTAPTMTTQSHEAPKSNRPLLLAAIIAVALVALVAVIAFGFDEEPPPPEDNAQLVQQLYEQAQAQTRSEELTRQSSLLLNEDSRDLRRSASTYILDYEPADEVPAKIRVLATLELAAGCDALRAALVDVRELGDPSLRGPVERRFPRRWRRGMRRDLYRCVRSEIRTTLRELGGEEEE